MPEIHKLPFAAVVLTGGSSGIGKSFITHIRKMDRTVLICNLSRRNPEAIRGELRVRHVTCDLSDYRSRRDALEAVLEILRIESPVGPLLLINNAGYGSYGEFAQGEIEDQLRMVEVNVSAVVDLTARLMPELLKRSGAVMNIASITSFQPTPFMATYGASKAFILHWSRGLREELKGRGVAVLAVCPGSTISGFHERAGMNRGGGSGLLIQTSEAVVTEAMQALAAGRGHVVTGWINKIAAAIAVRLPLGWSARISAKVLSRFRPAGQAAQ